MTAADGVRSQHLRHRRLEDQGHRPPLTGPIGRTAEESMVSGIPSNLVETTKSPKKYLEENKRG